MTDPSYTPDPGDDGGLPRWVRILGIIALLVVVLVVVMVLIGGGPGGHMPPEGGH